MTGRHSARKAAVPIRIRWLRVAGLLFIVAAIGAAVGHQSPGFSSSPGASRIDVPHIEPPVPDGTTVFDEAVQGVAKLDSGLRDALRRAANDAAGDGVELVVDSGWRSPAHQQRLLDEAISKYGSEAEAARWVATPDRSAHVSGDAVDIAASGAAWLSEHGAAYALCQTYGNEPWHYELRPQAIDHGCPPMYADPTHDPRMQR